MMRLNPRPRLMAWAAAGLALCLLAASCGADEDGAPSQDTAPAAESDDTAEPVSETSTESSDATPDGATDDVGDSEPVGTTAAVSEEPDGESAAADGEPIRVGNVSSLTGGALFPEASAAAKAVFDRVNDRGGISGRPLELIVEDDGGAPEGAAAAARKLVEQDNVVALVGSASVLECAVNSGFYAEQGVYSIQAPAWTRCASCPRTSPR
ncbi:ABC transporter substrate-binding protein [Candidatus Poriferisodalis sp.]|uniref:ABC transporter substrate-binding protein n=1 Tax=Candidatus Poriferisodalis sp. TaxID=3101277 RepID=UPI003B02C5DF